MVGSEMVREKLGERFIETDGPTCYNPCNPTSWKEPPYD